MQSVIISFGRTGGALLLVLICFASLVCAQNDADQTDVIRVNTDLVQTGVMVFDKRGKFVDGLRPEQFELRVDGKPVAFSFFDRVTAWTDREERQLAAANTPGKPAPASESAEPVMRGRTVIFFIDDLHLSLESIGRTRSAVNHFLDQEMSPLDQVAIASASGQIGFLQQLTDNKAVLRAALARLKVFPYVVRDNDTPPMTEYIAIRILNGDLDTMNYYADELLHRSFRPAKGINRDAIYQTIKNRANQILMGLENVTTTSLGSLENLMDTTGRIPGRKLIFYISDGFYLDGKNTVAAANDRLRRVINAATRTNSVIYTIDARGLFAPIADATGERPFDPTGRLDRANIGEGTMSQEGLNALAGDTGGRFLKNQNYWETWVDRMLDETSNYYLLAWRPAADEQKKSDFRRIQVTIAGRPDVTVRLPRGFLSSAPKSDPRAVEVKATLPDTAIPAAAAAKGPESALKAALGAPSARKGLPTQLSVTFLDVPGSGPVLTVATQMDTGGLGYGTDGKAAAAVDLAGVVLNDQGKQAGGFKTRLTVSPVSSAASDQASSVIYTHKLPLKPGLYQVRVASRDSINGKVGSAAQWIEVPDLSARQLTLSTLLLGGELVGSTQKQAGEQMQFSVDHRFRRAAHLNFLTIIYNGAQGTNGAPALDAQVQILRNGKPVITSPVRKVVTDGTTDLARIVHGADFTLQNLPPGRYLLQVTVSDRIAKTVATQQAAFFIE
jgi:VWFA-related protein